MTQVEFNNGLLGLKDKLYGYALSLTADSENANDLLQDTLLKALTFRDKFTANTNFKAWIYAIMRNTFINDYRRNMRKKNIMDSENNQNLQQISRDKVYPAPDSFYNSKEIYKAINNLEEEWRVPFKMFIEGYKYKEIADAMELPLGTVKSRIFLTRKKLTKSLHEYAVN